ncbi:MAG: glycerol-3-phosphate acyltransferase [Caldilinea sp.]|jgi:glycerol-3-phosphate acyltransferase PlsY|uniref:glycerol-3-phosphate acyltransferase n=1 Tax=Caldilinea sp. TaxID=2293560 RepID=UPI003096A887
MLEMLLWTMIGFAAGSLPFSVWIGRLALKKDITRYGDANPGATNVLRAGGRIAAALALLLDTLKAALPIGFAYYRLGIDDWRLVPVALAPAFGHAFSPFLGWRGGKAVAATLGMWMALTLWTIPTLGGVALLVFTLLVGANGWAVVFANLVILLFLLTMPTAFDFLHLQPAQSILLAIWVGNMALLLYKHRADLSHPPTLRSKQRQAAS